MVRVVWRGKIKHGKLDEYIRLHREIPEEMIQLFNQAGICNYTIWNFGDDLFGYYECSDFAKSNDIKLKSKVMEQWNRQMNQIMQLLPDPETGLLYKIQPVFSHD